MPPNDKIRNHLVANPIEKKLSGRLNRTLPSVELQSSRYQRETRSAIDAHRTIKRIADAKIMAKAIRGRLCNGHGD